MQIKTTFKFDSGNYTEKIKKMLDENKTRLIVDINDLREFDPKMAESFLSTPFNYLNGFNKALDEIVVTQHNQDNLKTQIGFIGNFGKYFVTPRQLLSNMIGRLVCVEGIITKSSVILPKLVESVHYCPETNKFLSKNYRDLTSMDGTPTGYTLPRFELKKLKISFLLEMIKMEIL